MTNRGLTYCLFALSACYGSDPYDPGPQTPEPPPVAADDHVTIVEDEFFPSAALIENDTDVCCVEVVVAPRHGHIENGNYVPDPGYFGTDQFTYAGRRTYSASDNTALATVYVTITSDGIGYEHAQQIGAARADDVAAADLDGDGKIDLVTCDSMSNTMTIFRNTTSAPEMFSAEKSLFEGGDTPRKIRTGDIDGDGRPDIVTATDGGPTIYRNITTPGGLLAFAAPVKLVTSDASSIAVVDLQGDGALDIVATTSYYNLSAALDVWINQSTAGTISFGTRTSFSLPPVPTDIAAVDADGNGAFDIAVLAAEKLSLFVNAMTVGATTPAFQTRIDRDTGPDSTNLFLADLDGDGPPELAVLHYYGELWVYANQGAASPTFEAARVLDLDASTYVVSTAQVDGDGLVDLVSVPSGELRLEILANRSLPRQYAFETREAVVADAQTRRIGVISSPTAMLYADLDGVAPAEIVIASRSAWSSTPAGLTVLYGP